VHADAGDSLVDFARRAAHSAVQPRIDAATVEVLGRFERDGIDVLLLKGAATAWWLYGPETARTYQDCDLLVAPDRVQAAARALDELGFERIDDRADPHLWPEARAQSWVRDGAQIDLQWRLPGVEGDPALAWTVLWAERDTMPLERARAPVLGVAARTMQLATHAALHGPQVLRSMQDLARGREQLDLATWRAAAATARRIGALDAFAAGLRLDPACAPLVEQLDLPEPSLAWTLQSAGDTPFGAFALPRWRATEGASAKLRLVWRAVFPTRAEMHAFYPRTRATGRRRRRAGRRRRLRAGRRMRMLARRRMRAGPRRRMLAARVNHVRTLPVKVFRGWRALRRGEARR
jgi:hypothetical protein